MLFKKTTYTDDFPINITIAQVDEYPFHYHQDVEFIYVLQGEIHLKNVCHHYHLKEGDIFTNSGHEIHGLTATNKNNVVAIIQISNRFFTQYFPSLTKACFMTYVRNDKSSKLDPLQKMILQILMDFSKRSFDYKINCINQMIEVIKYLNLHYNLFAFDGRVVTNFKSDNPVIVERISRIINYIYANHTNKITLEELASQEHLSTFYISHLIRDYMGINFKEFLCFARVEMSEILLLETNRKISTIAKDVGFSATSYYEKFFMKWFGHSPSKYRKLYTSNILSDTRPARLNLLSESQAITLIRHCMSAVSDQEKSASTISKLHLSININPEIDTVAAVHPLIEVVITQEDYHILGERLFNLLYDLNASKIILSLHSGDNETTTALISNRLNLLGYEVSTAFDNGLDFSHSAAYDSIAYAINIFSSYFTSQENTLHCKLRDQGEPFKPLKGSPSCITSCLIPKPSFYAYRFLKNIKGNMICRGKYYYVIKNDSKTESSYTIIVLHYSEEIMHLCSRNAGVYETNDLINAFKDELNIYFSIPAASGKYIVAKYMISNCNSIFSHMSHLGFPQAFPLPESWIHILSTEPKAQMNVEIVDKTIHISSAIKGAGIQVIVIEKID